MKLLFDQNLSYKLTSLLADRYSDCEHVRNIGLKSSSDTEIWQYAAREGYSLVTKDEDFHIRSLLDGPPPKILWIRSGNCSTELIETLLRKSYEEIETFHENEDIGFMTLH